MNRLLLAAAVAATTLVSVPAFAQTQDHVQSQWWQPSDVYASLGYTGINQGSGVDAHIGAITGRADARFGRYFGLEVEASGGVAPSTSAQGNRTWLDHQYAGYAVGYLPVMRNLDLFARAGYGDSLISYRGPTTSFEVNSESFNFGAGAQYFVTPHDGVRFEYTRQDAQDHFGPNADTLSLSYVRKF